MVPGPRYDINLSLHDILTPLMQTGLATIGTPAANPELDAHLAQLRQLAGNLKDVVDRINGIDPTVLSPLRNL